MTPSLVFRAQRNSRRISQPSNHGSVRLLRPGSRRRLLTVAAADRNDAQHGVRLTRKPRVAGLRSVVQIPPALGHLLIAPDPRLANQAVRVLASVILRIIISGQLSSTLAIHAA